MKVEAIGSTDDRARGGELRFGFSPIKNLELEIGAARSLDGSTNPDLRLGIVAPGAKWVPIQDETGGSLGARLDLGQTRIHDGETPRRGGQTLLHHKRQGRGPEPTPTSWNFAQSRAPLARGNEASRARESIRHTHGAQGVSFMPQGWVSWQVAHTLVEGRCSRWHS
ncbi:MAG: hypothetical protein RR758_00625 [Burkholderiaceae bacterium]